MAVGLIGLSTLSVLSGIVREGAFQLVASSLAFWVNAWGEVNVFVGTVLHAFGPDPTSISGLVMSQVCL